MKSFAALLDALGYAPQRTAKLGLMREYFRATPDPDRGLALAALTDGLEFGWPVRRVLADLVGARIDPELFRLSRDYVGDTAETVALIWPEANADGGEGAGMSLAEVVERLRQAETGERGAVLAALLDGLDATGRWAMLKLLTGGLRVGVSARLAKAALADAFTVPIDEIEEVWHGVSPPYVDLFAWLEGRGPRPDIEGALVFRPMMLAHPIAEGELQDLDLAAMAVEWKWDGIRVQLAANGEKARLFSRTGDDISAAFPDVLMHAGFDAVLDGELLVVREGEVRPFSELQQRLNRRTVSARQLKEFPAHVRLYDSLFLNGEDLRALPFTERRARLETWYGATPGGRRPRLDLSPLVEAADLVVLSGLVDGARAAGHEGVMLKRLDSPYLAGRPKGYWWKWKRGALTADCVLMYAQRGSGKRSSLYSDLTFGCWRETGQGERELVPVGKAYSGFTDEELASLDRWIRSNTVDRFGPVRAVKPGLVLEVAFDAVQRSSRHKSGIAMRFPRISRLRWDKPVAEADEVGTLEALVDGGAI